MILHFHRYIYIGNKSWMTNDSLEIEVICVQEYVSFMSQKKTCDFPLRV